MFYLIAVHHIHHFLFPEITEVRVYRKMGFSGSRIRCDRFDFTVGDTYEIVPLKTPLEDIQYTPFLSNAITLPALHRGILLQRRTVRNS